MIDYSFFISTFLKLLGALPVTLGLFFCSFFLGAIFSSIILCLRISRNRLLCTFAKMYILVFRGSPLLIQLFLIYYGLGQFEAVRESPLWWIIKEPFMCAVLSLALCTAAYTSEIFRGALIAIDAGEIEAARAIGMSKFLCWRHIIFPVMLRHALPAYSTEAVLMVKSTALASLITVWDVTGVAQQIIQQTYRTMDVFICASVIYLILNFLIIKIYRLLEIWLTPGQRRAPIFLLLFS